MKVASFTCAAALVLWACQPPGLSLAGDGVGNGDGIRDDPEQEAPQEIVDDDASGANADAEGTDEDACEEPVLILRPVEFLLPFSTSYHFTCDEAYIEQIGVWLFAGDEVALDVTLPCNGPELYMGHVEPGSYMIAAFAQGGPDTFVTGIRLLRPLLFPDHPECNGENETCQGIPATVGDCGATIMPLQLMCVTSINHCEDCCGNF
jgi:hypothetical protein